MHGHQKYKSTYTVISNLIRDMNYSKCNKTISYLPQYKPGILNIAAQTPTRIIISQLKHLPSMHTSSIPHNWFVNKHPAKQLKINIL